MRVFEPSLENGEQAIQTETRTARSVTLEGTDRYHARPISKIRTVYQSCDLCGSTNHHILYSKIDPVTGHEFHLVECECGMALVNPVPTEDSAPYLYPADYHHGKDLDQSRFRKMLEVLPRSSGKRLLDIGCGQGEFIYHASQDGWDAEGVDLIDWESPYPVNIKVGNVLHMNLPENSYDVITAWAVLEHVTKPSLYFERVSRLLRDGGSFVFLLPSIAAPGMKHSCTEDIPRHLWIFTPETVERYLATYGMEVRSVFHDGRFYKSYPFGLLRYYLSRLKGNGNSCQSNQNKAVSLLRNRQARTNFAPWLTEVIRKLGIIDFLLDATDMAMGLVLANISKIIGNYGIITVVATKQGTADDLPAQAC
jgi:SAM-dependent methyltransferase